MGHSIYLADDEKSIRELLHSFLASDGYTVRSFESGDALLEAFRQEPAELVILDIMMPGTDGLAVCRELRSVSDIPIILLTAKDSELDYVMGISQGSDDYLTKPFRPTILLMKVKALLRRARIVDEHRITIGDVELDYDTHTVRRGHDAQVLPPKEFNLLYKLLAYPERTFTRLELLDEIWGMDSESDDKTVNVHINRLRTRFYDWPEFEIQTIRGIGYRAIKKV